MLCIRKVSFVDRAETEALWSYELKRQWCYGEMMAVRVLDEREKVLGSTIPALFETMEVAGHSSVGVTWIAEDPVEEPLAPPVGETTAAPENPSTAASPDEAETAEPAASPVTPAERSGGAEAAPYLASKTSHEAERAAPEVPEAAEAPAAPTAPDALNDNSDAMHNVSPPASSSSAPVAEAANSADAEQPTAAVQENASAATDVEASAPPAPAAAPGTNGTSRNETPSESAPAATNAPALVSPVERKPSFSNCMPINIAGIPKGILNFEVITVMGTKVAVAVANAQSILEAGPSAAAPEVQHFAVLVTPAHAKAESASTVYAVLEFSVVMGTTDVATAVSLAAGATCAPMATPLRAGDTCAFSTRTFYYPAKFLKGTGVYIVTNVLCVESLSGNAVRIELALPEELKKMHVLLDRKAVLRNRGDRAYFTCTWDVFSTYVDTGKTSTDDDEPAAAGFHVLICDGAENRAPVDIQFIGEPPRAEDASVGPFMFFVNHAKVTNNSCSAAEETALMDILPIALVSRAGA